MKKVQVLGSGCPRCQQVAANAAEAAEAIGVEADIEKVSRPADIAKFGVMFTPGLAVEGEVVCAGRVPSVEEIKGWLAEDLDAVMIKGIEFAVPHKTVPPMETPVDHPLIQGLRQAAAHVMGDAQIAGVPYNTDASHYATAGIPCVVFGPGDIAQAHSVTEFVQIEQVAAAVEILKRFLLADSAPLD